MISLGDLLQKNKDSIIEKWLEDVFATYPDDSSALLKDQKDPFANPVGTSLRKGTRGIFEALLDGPNVEAIRRHLHEIIKIRAVQQFSASKAVGFVFLLKEALRGKLGSAAGDPRLSSDLTRIEEQIDRIALDAFDIFVHYREQVYELRVNELKRRSSWVVDRINRRCIDPDVDPDQSEEKAFKDMNVQREDLR